MNGTNGFRITGIKNDDFLAGALSQHQEMKMATVLTMLASALTLETE
jgi:hypothetical protein